jgi:hypothetical protein
LTERREVPLPETFFRQWDEQEMAIQQRLIANLLERPLAPDSFPLVALVFYRAEQGRDSFAYDDLLRFVIDNGGEEVLHAFVQWSMTQRMFFTGKYISPGYRQALKEILREDRGRRLRDKEWKKRWSSVRHADFRRLLEEVRGETASPLVKLFRRKSTALISVIVLLAAGATGGFFLLMPDSAPATPSSPYEGRTVEHAEQSRLVESAEFVPVYQLMLEPQIRPIHETQQP